MKELIEIQNELIAPKDGYNAFGKYKFRSAESILMALKPLLKKHNCHLTISDDMVMIGERYYNKATIILSNSEKETISVVAFAREQETQSGMQLPQISGSIASYSHKYALGNLFLIDDNKDSDEMNNGKEVKDVKTPIAKDKRTVLKAKSEEYNKIITWLNEESNKEDFDYELCLKRVNEKYIITDEVSKLLLGGE